MSKKSFFCLLGLELSLHGESFLFSCYVLSKIDFSSGIKSDSLIYEGLSAFYETVGEFPALFFMNHRRLWGFLPIGEVGGDD